MSDYSPGDYSPLGKAVRPYWGVVLKWVLVLVVIGLIIGVIGFVGGWFNAGKQIISPANVKAQYAGAYSRWEALKATTCNVKGEQTLVDNATDPTIKVQYQQQLSAYQQNYVRVAADYDAAYDNAFQAKHVGPSDIPRVAPTLSESLATAAC